MRQSQRILTALISVIVLTCSSCSPASLLNAWNICQNATKNTDNQTPSQTVTAAAEGALGSLKEVTNGDVWENMTTTETMRWNGGTDGACSSYPDGQCTWWACMRGRRLGMDIGSYWGNGADWAASGQAAGYTVSDDHPVAGAIVSFPPGVQGAHSYYGHVAVVEKVDPSTDTILISEMNVRGFIATSRVLPIKNGAHYILPNTEHTVSISTTSGTSSDTKPASNTPSDTSNMSLTAFLCNINSDTVSDIDQPEGDITTIAYSGTGHHATPEQAKALAKTMMKDYYKQWSLEDNFTALVWIWEHESGWQWNATNPSSGAYGIPQSLPASKLASAGDDWRDNAATQIKWGLDYIANRYGSPVEAKQFWLANNWY